MSSAKTETKHLVAPLKAMGRDSLHKAEEGLACLDDCTRAGALLIGASDEDLKALLALSADARRAVRAFHAKAEEVARVNGVDPIQLSGGNKTDPE